MPFIVWAALAVAILLIGISVSGNLPHVAESVGKSAAASMTPWSWIGMAAVVVIASSFWRRR